MSAFLFKESRSCKQQFVSTVGRGSARTSNQRGIQRYTFPHTFTRKSGFRGCKFLTHVEGNLPLPRLKALQQSSLCNTYTASVLQIKKETPTSRATYSFQQHHTFLLLDCEI